MKKIIVSQRIDEYLDINENREALDIRLSNMIYSMGMMPIPISSTVLRYLSLEEYLDELSPHGILLSGGNNIGESNERDKLEIKLLEWSINSKKPVLGICRGLQLINFYQGGKMSPSNLHCKTRHLLRGEKEFCEREVNSYHSYKVKSTGLGEGLVKIAWTNDDCVEAIRHLEYPWLAIMWHPEREEIIDKKDLKLISKHYGC